MPSLPVSCDQRENVVQMLSTSAVTEDKTPQDRVCIVAPGQLFRDGVRLVLKREGREVLGACDRICDVMSATAGNEAPHLIVVKLESGRMADHEFAAMQRVRAVFPQTRWIILGQPMASDLFNATVESGGCAILPDDTPAEVLQLIVELALRGYLFISAEIVASSLPSVETRSLVRLPPLEEDPKITAFNSRAKWSFSSRESEILSCLVEGHSNKGIARQLGIAEATVKVHVKGLLRKMKVANRTQAAISALGMFETDPPIARLPLPPVPGGSICMA